MKTIKILKILVWALLVCGITVLVGFINAEHRKITCKDIEITIDNNDADPMVTAEKIRNKMHPDTLIGKKLSEIDLIKIENKINSIPLLSRADVYTTITGNLNIHAQQCRPVVRVYTSSNQSYYFDQNGDVIPVGNSFPSRVLVASGNIRIKYADTLNVLNFKEKNLLTDLYLLAEFINNDRFLNAQIEQIYVNRHREFELVPKVGKHLIVLGSTEKMKEKFDKLMAFYEEGLNKTGWNKYQIINLKFENQVVCTKR